MVVLPVELPIEPVEFCRVSAEDGPGAAGLDKLDRPNSLIGWIQPNYRPIFLRACR